MKAKKIFTYGAIAFLSVTTAQLNAAEAEVNANVDLPKSDTRVHRDRDADVSVRTDRADTTTRERASLRHSNKASGLLGMEVRNTENQKLGEIKDLVMESPSKVNYAVLAVGGFLGIGEKLIALPPGALKVAEDGEYLILNADKAKIQAAPGFAATSWPSPNDPEIDRFWGDIRATGAPATSERYHRSDVDVNVDKDRHSVKGEVNLDKKQKIYTDADGNKRVKVERE